MERLKAGWAALLLCVGFWIGVLVTNLELYPIQIHGDKQRQATWSKTKTIEHSSPLIWNPLNPVSDSSRTASVAMNPRTLRRGKEIRYQPIDENCYKPKYLSGYGKSLCWDMNEGKPGLRNSTAVTCAPMLIVLGIHKCGTTDLRWALNSIKSVYAKFGEPYGNLLGIGCPKDYFESSSYGSTRKDMVGQASMGRYTVINSGGGFERHQVVEEEEDYFVIKSLIQQSSYLSSPSQRYIITLRNPTDRFLSHYFYAFSIGKLVFKSHTTVESIGKEFLHDKVEENIRYLEKCITEHGVTGCIFLREFIGDAPDGKVADILRMGCYYIFVEQTLKFIKGNLYVNMLEEYSSNKTEGLKRVLDYMDVPSEKRRIKRDESDQVRNKASYVKPVLQKTKDILDHFYEPFNQKLAELLNDEKWLYLRH